MRRLIGNRKSPVQECVSRRSIGCVESSLDGDASKETTRELLKAAKRCVIDPEVEIRADLKTKRQERGVDKRIDHFDTSADNVL